MLKYLYSKASSTSYALWGVILSVAPEDLFLKGFIQCLWADTTVIIINRLILLVLIIFILNIIYSYYCNHRTSVTISARTYKIKIEYKDILNITDGKKVINFDECFTTTVGTRPEEIRPTSICGQYLSKYPIDNMQALLSSSNIKPIGKSKYNGKDCYAPGTLVPKDSFLLMAFAKLDRNGLGGLTYSKYLKCLDVLWEQINFYYQNEDVYIPILGSGLTRFDKNLTQQELLDIMIASYRLYPNKMKFPHVLHIVCKEKDDFSLNKIIGI